MCEFKGYVQRMQNQHDEQRESIWSLRQLSLTRYYISFAVLFSLVTVLYLWRSFVTPLPGQHAVDTALAGLKEASSVIPWLIIFTYYLVEGVSMLAERYLRSRYAKGRQDGKKEGREEGRTEGLEEGREEGRKEGLTEGREEGREEERLQWRAWNQRREEALQAGREFTEPPPDAAKDRQDQESAK